VRGIEGAIGGGGEKEDDSSVSVLRIRSSEEGVSQGGGMIFARLWRLRRRPSQRGICARWGGRSAGVGPYERGGFRMEGWRGLTR